MRTLTATGITAGVVTALGALLTVWTATTLSDQGAWSRSGIDGRHLDFTLAALLLVGVALLITGVVLILAALAEYWFARQDLYDAKVEARRERIAAAREQARADSAHRIAH